MPRGFASLVRSVPLTTMRLMTCAFAVLAILLMNPRIRDRGFQVLFAADGIWPFG